MAGETPRDRQGESLGRRLSGEDRRGRGLDRRERRPRNRVSSAGVNGANGRGSPTKRSEAILAPIGSRASDRIW